MRQYELLEAMTFKHGRFQLTPEQLANRRYVTRFIGEPSERIVEPITEISFKRGEIVTTDLEIPRAVESKMRPLVEEAPAQTAQAAMRDSRESKPEAGATAPSAGASDDPLADIPDMPPESKDSPQPTGKRGRNK